MGKKERIVKMIPDDSDEPLFTGGIRMDVPDKEPDRKEEQPSKTEEPPSKEGDS